MFRSTVAVLLLTILPHLTRGQVDSLQNTVGEFYQLPYFTYGRGLGITSPDSIYQLNIRLRMQNRVGIVEDENEITSIEARVARLRLRFDGFVFNPKILYVVQVSFSSGDIDGNVPNTPVNILRDGVIFYQPSPKWSFGFGQTKLPGNRQRVVSSGDLQMPDRSLTNAIFNIDRDFGIQARYLGKLSGPMWIGFRGAVSSGEGRNWVTSAGNGLSYTLRMEVLPFGPFTSDGDYFEGDLLREPEPKLSAGVVYNYNNEAIRTQGQRGDLLFQPKDLHHFFADMIFKYRGWSVLVEYLSRNTANPLSFNPADPEDFTLVYKGFGTMLQGSYLFRKNYELVGRFDMVRPHEDIRTYRPERTIQYGIGANKYLRGHRLKLQTDLTYIRRRNLLNDGLTDALLMRFQIELGI